MDNQALLAALPELIAQACDPEIEWHEDPQRADARVYHGHDGVRKSFERWLDQWDEYGTEAERFIDCGDDDRGVAHVAAERLRVHARGDHQRGVGVAALVQRDAADAGGGPGLVRPVGDRVLVEWHLAGAAEDEALAPPGE